MSHNSFTPRACELLALLTERGDWMTRAELAKALDKPNLTAYDTTQLEMLEGKGRIEVRSSTASKWRMAKEYKAK